YGYDAVGNILSIDDGLQASLNQKFEYDALDRLALESGYFGQKTYQFDEVGNRTQRVWTTKADASGNSQTKKQVLSYHNNSNRLNKLDNQTVSLDAMGNTLASQGANATYDARGRLSSMTVNGELRAKYTYNAIGERVVKERILGGQSYYGVYQYDLAGQLLAEANYSSTRKLLDRHYVWLGSMPVAMIEVHYQGNGKVANTQVSYIHSDHLNTPRRATNTEGNIVWAWYSDAYGVGQVADNPDGDGQTVTLNLRFPGQYYDAESGLFYNYFRDYDPSTGRYIESDPIGLNGGLNTFAYVEGNPVGYIDPLGLERFGPRYRVTDYRSNWTEEDWCRHRESMDNVLEIMFVVATAGEGLVAVNSLKFLFRSIFKRKANQAIAKVAKYGVDDFAKVGKKVSQKQNRHIAGRKEYRGGGYLDSVEDAQKVLDSFNSGSAKIIGKSKQGFPIVKVDGVTGTNVSNVASGSYKQSTNVFMIKGTKSPSVVPMNPNWTP
ncbi:hypothetical protein KCM76_25295, partial [Zooshikella marina]|uniref:RHS repeat-associated core domain-containing protein n=1 Tax=Zooshikella ganghwensis TaxID=202772 RepID=UPI001C186A6D